MTTRCSSCTAAIFWARTESGARMPMDDTPAPLGRFVFVRDGRGTVRMLRYDETTTEARYTSHFATCPHASRHRRVQVAPDYGETPLARSTPASEREYTERDRPRDAGRDYKAERNARAARRK